ncbi:hypothetical protein NPIL_585081 [Nephila pilipes]|uniref:Uncharacterized protein n=1 Tax=Nephila pilipes TaxID=299642 RepID=A0A8X6QKM7_NEPPI|nr:hypothetical protein NPIL_585081 [Nephila pilipes]
MKWVFAIPIISFPWKEWNVTIISFHQDSEGRFFFLKKKKKDRKRIFSFCIRIAPGTFLRPSDGTSRQQRQVSLHGMWPLRTVASLRDQFLPFIFTNSCQIPDATTGLLSSHRIDRKTPSESEVLHLQHSTTFIGGDNALFFTNHSCCLECLPPSPFPFFPCCFLLVIYSEDHQRFLFQKEAFDFFRGYKRIERERRRGREDRNEGKGHLLFSPSTLNCLKCGDISRARSKTECFSSPRAP